MKEAINLDRPFVLREMVLADLSQVVKVDRFDELDHENGELDWVIEVAYNGETADEISKTSFTKCC